VSLWKITSMHESVFVSVCLHGKSPRTHSAHPRSHSFPPYSTHFITMVTKHSEQSFKRILMLDQKKNYMDL